MSGSQADFWQGPSSNLPVVNTAGNIFEEVQIAILNQTVFTLASFSYTPGTHSIFVWKNGLMLRRATDYTETNSVTITLAVGCAAGDKLWFIAIAVNQLTPPIVFNGQPSGGTAGQILTKNSGSDYDSSWQSASNITTLLDAARQNIASASTVNLSAIAATTRNIQITGTVQIDGFQVTNGQVWVSRFAASLILKNNANIVTQAGQDIKTTPGDTCLIRATADNVVEIIAYSRAAASLQRNHNDFRLTLVTGVPVPTVDTNSAILYCTPYAGNKISLFNGTSWVVRESAEFNTGALAGLTVGRPYDVFCYDNAGIPTLETLIWTSTTVRATALTTQDGVLVKNGDATRKYLGTIVPTGAAQLTDSERQRLVWNYYNRVHCSMSRSETAANWTYNGAQRQVNNNALNQLEIVVGVVEDSITVRTSSQVASSGAAGGTQFNTDIGEDSTTVGSAVYGSCYNTGVNFICQITSSLTKRPAVGFHYYAWQEFSSAAITTWSGTRASGIQGSWKY
jgi:hypothetical protein